MVCALCGAIKERLTKHHIYFPKKRYSGKEYRHKQVSLCRKHHMGFNRFFDNHCKNRQLKVQRHCSYCYYEKICIYEESGKVAQMYSVRQKATIGSTI